MFIMQHKLNILYRYLN